MKRKILISWILILTMLLCSCNLRGGGEETGTDGADTEVSRTVELVANGKALYKIVLPEQASGEISRAADTLKRKLKTLTGVVFSVTDDYTQGGIAKDSTGEIIIGDCKRTEMQTELSNLTYRDYSVTITDNNILIAGYEDSKVSDAIYAFIDALTEETVQKGDKTASLIWKGDIKNQYTSYKLDGISLSGVALTEYAIVYPSEGQNADSIAKYLESALELRDCIGKRCGYALQVVPDTTKEQTYEILIGKTNRAESIDHYDGANGTKQMEYGLAIRGNKVLLLCGGLYSLPSAVDAFTAKITSLTTSTLKPFSDSKATLANQSIPQATGDYRFMTYNILYEEYVQDQDLPKEVEVRKEPVSYLLMNYLPDVAALQESFDKWSQQLPKLISDEYAYVCPKRDDGAYNRSPLIYRKDRLKVVESGYEDLDQTVTAGRRQITWAVFEDKATGTQFAVLGTHWDPTSEDNKLEHAKATAALTKKIREERNIPVVVMADFNAIPGSVSYSTFKVQSGIEYVTGTGGVDHVFYTADFTAVAQGWEEGNCADQASDHYPVWADLKLK